MFTLARSRLALAADLFLLPALSLSFTAAARGVSISVIANGPLGDATSTANLDSNNHNSSFTALRFWVGMTLH